MAQGRGIVRVECEVGSGMSSGRSKARRSLADPAVGVVVEHRDRLACFGTELVEAALAASGRELVVEERELDDDLVRDMTEVLSSFCARLYGRRSTRNRARRALEGRARTFQDRTRDLSSSGALI